MITTKIKNELRAALLRAARYTSAVLFGIVGAGFLTSAAWQAAADKLSPVEASLMVGAVYAVIALAIVFYPQKRGEQKTPQVDAADLVNVFVQSARAGRHLRS